VTEAANDSKVEESPSTQKDEKKEKVKKKRSFRSFSFLRREKKTKEENNKNGDVAKEVSPTCIGFSLFRLFSLENQLESDLIFFLVAQSS
jgi:hypothetical protein